MTWQSLKPDFGSTRLAFVLIALLILHIALSAVIPQKGIAEDQIIDWHQTLGDYYSVIEKLDLDRIYYSPSFFLVLGLLALNIIVGNLRRFRSVYRIEKTLLKARHLGSIIFHLALVLIMGAVILNYLYKFEGVFSLTEGQNASDSPDNYFRTYEGPLYSEAYDRFEIGLVELIDSFTVGETTTNAALIELLPKGYSSSRIDTIATNQPMRYNDLEFHFGIHTGYSPELKLSDSAGNELLNAFVRLATQRSDGTVHYADFVEILSGDFRVELEVLPDSVNIDSSLIKINVDRDGRSLYLDTLRLNQTAEFDGNKIVISRLRRWCYVNVIRSPYLGLVFFGFWSALAGMVIGFVPRLMRKP